MIDHWGGYLVLQLYITLYFCKNDETLPLEIFLGSSGKTFDFKNGILSIFASVHE